MTEDNPQGRRSRRVVRDNVIYANFGNKTTVSHASSPATEPERRQPVRPGTSDSANRLRELITQSTDNGRLSRGRDYYMRGHVLNPKISRGVIHADVAGSQNLPFQVSVIFPYRSTEDLGEVSTIMARGGQLEAAHKGVIDQDVLDILTAEGYSEMRYRCSCPDNTPCCKHAAATMYHVADMMDADASLVFALRGIALTSLEQTITMKARGLNSERAAESYEGFWTGSELPDLPTPKKAPALEDSDEMLLHKAMRMVSYTSVDELRAVADIEDLYDYLTRDR